MGADEVIAVESRDHIFKQFFSFTCNIKSIIHLTLQIVKDLTYDESSRLNSVLEGRRFTGNIGKAVSEGITKKPFKRGRTRNVIDSLT